MGSSTVQKRDVEAFEAALLSDGVGLFPADTVYGLAADAESTRGVERLYDLKGRPPAKPAAVMFFDPDLVLGLARDLGPRTRAALARLLPGPVTLIVPNPERRYPLACGPAPDRLGIRVPGLPEPLAPLLAIRRPILQSSANPSGGPDPRRLEDVEPAIRAGVDAEVDGGELPGTASTVVDLTRYEVAGHYEVLRAGAVAPERIAELL
jgi:L-threonylcarbamoyladenylate synthase